MNRSFRPWVCVAVLVAGVVGCADDKPTPRADTPAPDAVGGNNKNGESAADKNNTEAAATAAVAVTKTDFAGVEKAILDANGKVVLIDCWATWCGPCVRSFPLLLEKHQKYAAKGLAVISLSTDKASDAPKVLDFLKRNNATFTNLHVPLDAAVQKSLQQKFAYRNAIPHAVLFDKTGTRVWGGHPMDDDLVSLIEAELAK